MKNIAHVMYPIWWYIVVEQSAFPDENSQKLKTPKDLMPLYLYLMVMTQY